MTTALTAFQVIFEVGGDGKLKASLTDIGKEGERAAQGLDKASASQERMTRAAKLAGAALGTALVSGLWLIIKNSIEAERVDAQLEARLRSTAGAAGMTKQALDDLAASTARKTTFDDEAIKSAEALLLTFTQVHADVFPRAIDAITDMSVAMEQDLQSSVIQVGKALNDPIQGVTALQRVGVQFTAAQKDVIEALVKTGDVAKAQALILQELEKEFGNSAEAARDTLGGALQALGHTLMDLTEGGPGSLEGAKDAVNDLTDALNDPAVRAGFEAIVSGVASVTTEVAQGIAILASYIQKYRDIANLGNGDLSRNDASDSALQNRLAAISNTKRNLQQGGPIGALKALYAPDSALGASGLFKSREQALKELSAESTAIIREMTQRNREALVKAGVDKAFDGLSGPPSPRRPWEGGASAKKGKGAGRAAKPKAMPDFGDEDLRNLQRMVEEAARADEQFAKLAATLAGPLASAEYEHQQNLQQIDELGRKAGRTSEEITRLKAAETDRYREERAAIEASLNPMQQLLDAELAELEAIGLGNTARAMMNELRRKGIDLASEEAQTYMRTAAAIDLQRDQALRANSDQLQAMDSLRDSARGFLDDLSHGVGVWDSLKNAADSFADTLFQIASRKLIEQIFGGYGTKGTEAGNGGGLGNLFGNLLGALFGGQRAQGGDVRGSRIYEVTEHGRPEIYETNGRKYLLPGADGYVRPMAQAWGGGGGGDQYFSTTIQVRGDVTTRTARQLAVERGHFMAREAARS